eukprot:CAMPEP_0206482276 /NCGR_PEP_ID=MMETSP0324_2-20121206/38796_1 /ASSEMBLY_ACC=CAM_ASM_000836 /TAXON_ID=2866 /ORGANISM="Crypthecodinium cohnii, Strain Seligo" /LENGTH=890 /DNA_ID=CAMNT_0053960229 /DNA_START=99 /DNA_END=2771 /DNA_ORIENTATION=-
MSSAEEVPLVTAEQEAPRGKRWATAAAVLGSAALVFAGARGAGLLSSNIEVSDDHIDTTALYATNSAAVPQQSLKDRELLFPLKKPQGGGLSGSFTLDSVSADDTDMVKQAVQDALASIWGSNVNMDELSISLIPTKAVGQTKTIKLPEPTADQQQAIEQFQAIKDSFSKGNAFTGFASDAKVARAEKLAQADVDETGARRLEVEDRELFHFGKGSKSGYNVHFSYSCSGASCPSVVSADALEAKLKPFQFGPVMHMSCPGKEIECSAYTCSNPYATNEGEGTCFGSDCEETCCVDPTCSMLTCDSGIDNIEENADLTCTSKEDCQDTCCHLRCAQFECMEGTCNDATYADVVVKPCEAQAKCCTPIEPCCADIAWCKASLECLSVTAWCAAQATTERLLTDIEEPLSAGVLPALDAGKPAHSAKTESVFSAAAAAKDRVRRLQGAEADSLKVGLDGLADEIVAFHDVNSKTGAPRELGQTITNFGGKGNLRGGKKADCPPAGCRTVAIGSCAYYYESIFCLHRGHSPRAIAVNTVQVLSDTVHAVSCGNDATCWVWRICDGKPRSHFVPKTSYGPIMSASVLFDSMHIVSGGIGTLYGGVAHVWDWRSGKQVATTHCTTGPFLSSAEIPEAGTVLLGCGNGYTYKWNWHSGESISLPHITIPGVTLIKKSMVLVHKCKSVALAAMDKLLHATDDLTMDSFVDAIMPVSPDMKKLLGCLYYINDMFYGTAFGPVKAVAYVPTYVRFVTGSGDGRVRYWNSRNGQLLKVMGGHRGPVNAIVGDLTKQEAISGGEDGTVRVWCLEKGVQKFLFIQDYAGPVLSLAIYPASRIIVVGSADGYVRFWDLHSGMLLCGINTGGKGVNGVAINPSGPLGQILAAGADGYVRVFNPR